MYVSIFKQFLFSKVACLFKILKGVFLSQRKSWRNTAHSIQEGFFVAKNDTQADLLAKNILKQLVPKLQSPENKLSMFVVCM